MKMLWTSRLIALVTLAGVLDVLSTDLRYEASPVMLALGTSVKNLILLKCFMSVVVVVGFYGGLRMLEARRSQVRPSRGLVSFLGWLFFKQEASAIKIFLWGWPRDWGAVMAVALVCSGVCAVSGGVSAAATNTLHAIRSQAGLVMFYLSNVFFSLVAGLYLAYAFLRSRPFVEQGASP